MPERPSEDEVADRMVQALARGEIEAAERFRQQARRYWPRSAKVHLWAATVSRVQWDFRRALAELRVVHRAGGHPGLPSEELNGRIGELLFLMGRYPESAPWLEDDRTLSVSLRRRALARMASLLSGRRPISSELPASELQLIPGSLPRLAGASGDKVRAFVLDTGATVSAVSRTLAADLAVSPILPAGSILDGSGHAVPADLGLLPEMSLGTYALGDIPVLVLADAHLGLRDSLEAPTEPVGGVVGMDVLARVRLTLDPERRSVVLEGPRGLDPEQSLPCLWGGEAGILVPVLLDGKRLWFRLDTGASHTTLTPQGLDRIPDGRGRVTRVVRRLHGVGGVRISAVELPNVVLQAGEVRFRRLGLPVVAREVPGPVPVHGVLGADLLLRCRLTLDSGRVQLVMP